MDNRSEQKFHHAAKLGEEKMELAGWLPSSKDV
jgi:hypothetical protein